MFDVNNLSFDCWVSIRLFWLKLSDDDDEEEDEDNDDGDLPKNIRLNSSLHVECELQFIRSSFFNFWLWCIRLWFMPSGDLSNFWMINEC